jgi:hypothetical protein
MLQFSVPSGRSCHEHYYLIEILRNGIFIQVLITELSAGVPSRSNGIQCCHITLIFSRHIYENYALVEGRFIHQLITSQHFRTVTPPPALQSNNLFYLCYWGMSTVCRLFPSDACVIISSIIFARVLGYGSVGSGSIPGTTRKKSSGSGTGSTQPREYNLLLDRKVAAPV